MRKNFDLKTRLVLISAFALLVSPVFAQQLGPIQHSELPVAGGKILPPAVPTTCNGMALNGSTDDLTALNACLAVVTPGVPVDVQPGLIHLSGNPTGVGSVVRLSQNKYGTGGSPGSIITEIGPDILTESYLPSGSGSTTKFYGKKNLLAEPPPTLRIDGIFNATSTSATSNTVNAEQKNCTVVAPSGSNANTDYVWCDNTTVTDNGQGGAQNVAVASNIFRPLGSLNGNNTWAFYGMNADLTGQGYGQANFNGGQNGEFDYQASGPDQPTNASGTSGLRMVTHLGLGRNLALPNQPVQAGNVLVLTTGQYNQGCTHVGCAIPDFANHAISINSEWGLSGIDFSTGQPLSTVMPTSAAQGTPGATLQFSVTPGPLVDVLTGMAVTGTNIAAGTTVSAVNPATGAVTLSASTSAAVGSGVSITFTSSGPAINLAQGQTIDLSNGAGGTISDNGTQTVFGHPINLAAGTQINSHVVPYSGGSGGDLGGYTATPSGTGTTQAAATAVSTIISQRNVGITYGLVDDGVFSSGSYTGTDNTQALLKLAHAAAIGTNFTLPKGIMVANMANTVTGTPSYSSTNIPVTSATYNSTGMGSVKLVLNAAPNSGTYNLPPLLCGQQVLVGGFTTTGASFNGWDTVACQNSTDSTGGTTVIIPTPAGNPGTISGSGSISINTMTVRMTYQHNLVGGETVDWKGVVPSSLASVHTLSSVVAGNSAVPSTATITFPVQTNPGTVTTLGHIDQPNPFVHTTNFGLDGACDSTTLVYTGDSPYIHFFDFGFGLGSAKGGPAKVRCITFQSTTQQAAADSNPLHAGAAIYVSNSNNINFENIYVDFTQSALGNWWNGVVNDATVAATFGNLKITAAQNDDFETFGPGVDPVTYLGNGNQFNTNLTGESRFAGAGANDFNLGGGMDMQRFDHAIMANSSGYGVSVNEALSQGEYLLLFPDNNGAFPSQRGIWGDTFFVDYATTAGVDFNQPDQGSTHILHSFTFDNDVDNTTSGPGYLITACNDCRITVHGRMEKNNNAGFETNDASTYLDVSGLSTRNQYGFKADVPVTLGRVSSSFGAGADANSSGNIYPNGDFGINMLAVLPPMQACAAAGSTQGTATALTGSANYIAAGGSANTGCLMPATSAIGTTEISLTNLDSVAHNLWPQTGDTLSGTSGVNSAYSIAAGSSRACRATSVNTGVIWACH